MNTQNKEDIPTRNFEKKKKQNNKNIITGDSRLSTWNKKKNKKKTKKKKRKTKTKKKKSQRNTEKNFQMFPPN